MERKDAAIVTLLSPVLPTRVDGGAGQFAEEVISTVGCWVMNVFETADVSLKYAESLINFWSLVTVAPFKASNYTQTTSSAPSDPLIGHGDLKACS